MKRGILGLASLVAASARVQAAEVVWNFDISTRGQDVTWNSPTVVDPSVPEYDADYQVSHVYATVQYLFFPETTVEVTSQIPAIYLSSSGTVYGPPPVTVVSQAFVFPNPPAPLAVAADLALSIEADGHGRFAATNVDFGTYQLNLPPFGTVTVNIRGIRVVGSVAVRAIYAGDLDRDSDVDVGDLALLLSAFGTCAADPLFNPAADLDASGCITISDLALLLSNYGRG